MSVSVNDYIRSIKELTEWNKAVMARKKKKDDKRKLRDKIKRTQGLFK